MDLRKIKKLIELVEESDVRELEVKSGEESIRISRGEVGREANPRPTDKVVSAPPRVEGHVVAAPMAGTFYRSPAPGEGAFVAEGDTVSVGQVLCIIESMKMMNQIEADCEGTVVEILVANGHAIESGTPLMRIL
ncbi:MAG: acetyl-CoA carboxylase biotin carboxyl carrier protein subunit [Gammaproteobacteria bacterium]|nr:MAG: acetyl-CoA carboxylase biotin carboxyl carrier protein subunit [Gammaproteobacteria bacterium]